jgi:phosphatidate cytidylyltransferase
LPVDPLNEPQATIPTSESRVMRELMLRVVSAAVLAPVALWCVWAGAVWFVVLVSIVTTAAGGEWRRLAGLETRVIGNILIMGPLFVVIAAVWGTPVVGLGILAVTLVLTSLAFGSPWAERKWALIALPHVALAALALLTLRQWPDAGRELVFFLLGSVWLSDIGGYVIGRIVGGPKLALHISPKKTWSGAVGALAFAVAGAVVFASSVGIATVVPALMAAILSVAAQAGDLFESGLKRRFGVKDSGKSIPGHGGVLDRVDGVLFAAPVMVVMVYTQDLEFVRWL